MCKPTKDEFAMASSGLLAVLPLLLTGWLLVPQAHAQSEAIVFVPELAAVRSGPGTDYDRLGELTAEQTAPALGRSARSDWIQIQFNGQLGWVYAPFVELRGMALDDLPVVEAPPTPTLPPTRAGEAILLTPAPTRAPTFTPAAPAIIPTYAPQSLPGPGFPPALLVIALLALGVFGAVMAVIRRNA